MLENQITIWEWLLEVKKEGKNFELTFDNIRKFSFEEVLQNNSLIIDLSIFADRIFINHVRMNTIKFMTIEATSKENINIDFLDSYKNTIATLYMSDSYLLQLNYQNDSIFVTVKEVI